MISKEKGFTGPLKAWLSLERLSVVLCSFRLLETDFLYSFAGDWPPHRWRGLLEILQFSPPENHRPLYEEGNPD
jgi:hypothetical protein